MSEVVNAAHNENMGKFEKAVFSVFIATPARLRTLTWKLAERKPAETKLEDEPALYLGGVAASEIIDGIQADLEEAATPGPVTPNWELTDEDFAWEGDFPAKDSGSLGEFALRQKLNANDHNNPLQTP